jgi:hypothetical protein
MFIYFLLGIIASLVYVYYKVVKPSKYWEERDVVHVKSWPHCWEYEGFRPEEAHHGGFHRCVQAVPKRKVGKCFCLENKFLVF